MKVDTVVIKETINIAIGILIFSTITQIIFFVFGRYDLTVFLGSLYGGIIVLLNFFLMGLTVQSITKIEDEKTAKKKMQYSYTMRQLMLIILIGVGMHIAVNLKIFHWLPILIAVIYPRLTIAFIGILKKKQGQKRGD